MVRHLQGEFAADHVIRHLEIVVNGSAVPDVRTFQDRRHELFDHRCMRKIAEAVTKLPLSSISLKSLANRKGNPDVDMKFLMGALLSRCGNYGVRYLGVDSLYRLMLYGETLRHHKNILGHYGGQRTKGFHVYTWMPEYGVGSLDSNGFVLPRQLVFAGLYVPYQTHEFEEDGVCDLEASIKRISTSIEKRLPHLRYSAFCLMEGGMIRCSYRGHQYIDLIRIIHYENEQIVMKSITYDVLLQPPQLKQMCLITAEAGFFRAHRTMEVGAVNVETRADITGEELKPLLEQVVSLKLYAGDTIQRVASDKACGAKSDLIVKACNRSPARRSSNTKISILSYKGS
ncbi:hypothetical protein FPCIR_3281 [Fusarium pseudocircinatum]|uniref:Uncharacterized protein n=1 Tax=Fusarium pseudocircinatum TaxID=56676 RepID=A0A8H5PJM4_9HYPO|nr:hypothetical protein FPCIR_3281 [Fusarium pseudocircinatum]